MFYYPSKELFSTCNYRTAQTRIVVEHVVYTTLVVHTQLRSRYAELVNQAVVNGFRTFLAQAFVQLLAAGARICITRNRVNGLAVGCLDGFCKQAQVRTRFV